MQKVFVLDTTKQPLQPCYPARARQLLKKERASIPPLNKLRGLLDAIFYDMIRYIRIFLKTFIKIISKSKAARLALKNIDGSESILNIKGIGNIREEDIIEYQGRRFYINYAEEIYIIINNRIRLGYVDIVGEEMEIELKYDIELNNNGIPISGYL